MARNFFKTGLYVALFLAAAAVAVFLVIKAVNIDKTGEVPMLEGKSLTKAAEIYTMPSFEGQVLEEAKLTLLNLGMKVRKITRVHSDTVEKDRIIAQRPLPGNIENNEINFLVSLGPHAVSYKCPEFVNMTTGDARVLAGELGINLNEKEEGGRVIDQKPAAGTIINKGDNVEIVLGRGSGKWF